MEEFLLYFDCKQLQRIWYMWLLESGSALSYYWKCKQNPETFFDFMICCAINTVHSYTIPIYFHNAGPHKFGGDWTRGDVVLDLDDLGPEAGWPGLLKNLQSPCFFAGIVTQVAKTRWSTSLQYAWDSLRWFVESFGSSVQKAFRL